MKSLALSHSTHVELHGFKKSVEEDPVETDRMKLDNGNYQTTSPPSPQSIIGWW